MFFRKKKDKKVGEEGYVFKYYLYPFPVDTFYPPPPAPSLCGYSYKKYKDGYNIKNEEYSHRVKEWEEEVYLEKESKANDSMYEKMEIAKKMIDDWEKIFGEDDKKEEVKTFNRFEYLDLDD